MSRHLGERPSRRPWGRRAAASATIVALALVAPIYATTSGLTLARSKSSTARTPALIPVGLSTPKATAPQNYSVTGVAANGTSDRLVNLRNDGTASTPGIGLDLAPTSSTSLDTDATNGLRVQVALCSTPWQQTGATGAATCQGTATTILTTTPLASLPAGGQLVSGLTAGSTGGVDHLRVRYSLPATAPGSYSALTSTSRLYVWGTYTTPTAPTALTATPADGQVALSWTAPAQAGFTAVTSYTVTGSPSGSCTTSGATACTISSLANGTTYTFTVTATNSVGTGPASSSATAIPYPSTLTGTGNVLWLDANDSSTLYQDTSGTTAATTAGQSVGLWKDKSGQGNNVTAASTGPSIENTVFSPKPSLVFNNGKHMTRSTGFVANQDYTEFAVYRSTSNSCTGNVVSGTSTRAFYLNSGGGITVFHSSSTVIATGGAGATVNRAYVSSGTYTNSTKLATVDAIGGSANSATLTNGNTDTGFVIGAYQTGNNYFCGQIAEISVFSRLFTATERRAMTDYLGRKWTIPLVPQAPTGVSATPSAGQLAVSWTASAYDGGASITGYTATAVGGGSCTTTTATACTITGLTGNTTYTVNVTATNSAGTSPAGTTSATTPVAPPAAPTGLTATRGNTHATASWTAPNNNGAAITSYTVTATPGNLTCTTATLTCQISGMTNGITYTLTVTATNSAGTGPASSSTTVTPAAVPGPPTGLTTTPGDAAGSVTWVAPADNGGTAIASYTATATPTDSSLPTRTCNGGAAATTCSFTGLTNGAPYKVTVAATNSTGLGETSTAVELVPYPASLLNSTNLAAWYDAADSSRTLTAGGTAATSGQNVATVNDRSGNGLNVTQATGANQATLSTLNGRAALASTAATTYASTATGTFRQVFSAASYTSGSYGYILSAPANTDFSLRLTSGALATPNANDWGFNGADWTNSVALKRTAPSGGAIFTAQAAADVTAKTLSLSSGFSSNTRGLVGRIGEVVVTNRVFTAAETRTVEEYLARKWAVTISPSAPVISSVTKPVAGSLTVTWTAPSWAGGSAVTGYTATATGTGGSTCTGGASATTCTITGLTTGQTYPVTLTATNAIGVGPSSAAVNGTP